MFGIDFCRLKPFVCVFIIILFSDNFSVDFVDVNDSWLLLFDGIDAVFGTLGADPPPLVEAADEDADREDEVDDDDDEDDFFSFASC